MYESDRLCGLCPLSKLDIREARISENISWLIPFVPPVSLAVLVYEVELPII